MSNPLTKYVAAAAIAGAVAFGGYTIAGAQHGGSTTTTPPAAQGEPHQAPPTGEHPGGCDHDKGDAGSSSGPGSDSGSSSNAQSNFTNT
jgi:hypothetical protein